MERRRMDSMSAKAEMLNVVMRVTHAISQSVCAVSFVLCRVIYDVRVFEDARVSVDERVAVLGDGLIAKMNVALLIYEPLCPSAMVATTKFFGTAWNGTTAGGVGEYGLECADGYA